MLICGSKQKRSKPLVRSIETTDWSLIVAGELSRFFIIIIIIIIIIIFINIIIIIVIINIIIVIVIVIVIRIKAQFRRRASAVPN